MSLVVAIQKGGIFVSLNQRYHIALVGWWQLHWGRS